MTRTNESEDEIVRFLEGSLEFYYFLILTRRRVLIGKCFALFLYFVCYSILHSLCIFSFLDLLVCLLAFVVCVCDKGDDT